MRHILLDLGNGSKDEIFGKDLASTDAPCELIALIAKEIKTSEYAGIPAEEAFIQKIKEHGYEIKLIASIEEIEMIPVSADSY